ncbi:MAG TPA: glycosyltransferase family 39 protein [Longilinea sp.]|nr:glycosyltransferase family 39 protein [Longilinea sp.]
MGKGRIVVSKRVLALTSIVPSLLALVIGWFALRRKNGQPRSDPSSASAAQPESPPPSNPTSTSPVDQDSLLAENLALKQRLEETQQRLRLLEEKSAGQRSSFAIPSKASLLAAAVALGVLALAAIPSILVVLHRWMNRTDLPDIVRPVWCKVDFLCGTELPSYFLYIFVICLALLALSLTVRFPGLEDFKPFKRSLAPDFAETKVAPVQRAVARWVFRVAAVGFVAILLASWLSSYKPGWLYLLVMVAFLVSWALAEVPLAAALDTIRRNAYLIGSLLLVQMALALFLADLYSGKPFQWIYLFLLILALILASLVPVYRRIHPVVGLIFLAEIVFTIQINSWIYSIVGDEYSFFGYVTDAIQHQDFNAIGANLFNGSAVYGSHPYFSSLLQAISMALLGTNNFGWRFSSVFLAAVSIGFFYLFFKNFVSERVALITAALLAVSQYLMNFGKIGYNNLQALFVMGLILWAGGFALRYGRSLGFFILGLCMGGAFYVYPAALYILPIPIIFLLFYLPPVNSQALRRWGAMVAGMLLLVFPLFFQPEYWQSKIAGTIFNAPSITQSAGDLGYHLGSNFLYALFSYVYAAEQTHFVYTSYVDPFTAIFVPIGVALLIKKLKGDRFPLFILTTFLVELFLVGVSHDRIAPSATRMFLLLPWFFFFAALGMDWIVRTFARLSTNSRLLPALLSSFLVISLAFNLYQAYPLYRQSSSGSPDLEMLFLRLLQHDEVNDHGTAKTYLFITQPDWGIDGIRILQDVYSVPDSQSQLLRTAVETPDLPSATVERIKEDNTLVIIQPWMDETLRVAIEDELKQLGKSSCEVRDTPQTDPQFTLWYSPDMQGVCEEANQTY